MSRRHLDIVDGPHRDNDVKSASRRRMDFVDLPRRGTDHMNRYDSLIDEAERLNRTRRKGTLFPDEDANSTSRALTRADRRYTDADPFYYRRLEQELPRERGPHASSEPNSQDAGTPGEYLADRLVDVAKPC